MNKINVGEVRVIKQYRLPVGACRAHDIKEGDRVEVWIRDVKGGRVINLGDVLVQKLYRIGAQEICKAHDIRVGDWVEVWIKKVSQE